MNKENIDYLEKELGKYANVIVENMKQKMKKQKNRKKRKCLKCKKIFTPTRTNWFICKTCYETNSKYPYYAPYF